MKKLVALILIVFLILGLFAGCKQKIPTIGDKPDLNLDVTEKPTSDGSFEPSSTVEPGNSSDSGSTRTTTPEPIVVIPSEAMRIIVPRNSYNQFTEKEVLDWEEYIIDKYGYEIDIVTVKKDWDTPMSAYISLLEQKASEGGFIYVSDLITLNALADSGLIEPVNSHIGKVDRYNVLPDDLIMKLSDTKGDMWGFPLSDSLNTFSLDRYYSNDWLEAADMTAPKTIEEFYQFAMFVANTDLDGNGEYDSYVASYADFMWLYDLGDIFRAFGCYYDFQNPIAYNPNKGIYENCIFNENFVEAMTFVKLLYDEGVIFNRMPNTGAIDEISLETHQIAATSRLDRENIFENGLTVGSYLTGINQENISERRYSSSCLAVINGTPDVAEKMAGFMNLLTSNPNSRMDFAYGIEGVHYEDIDDDYFNVNNKDTLGNTQWKRMEIHIGLSDMGFAEKYIVMNGNDFRLDNAEFYEMVSEARDEKEEINPDVQYIIPFSVYDSRIEDVNSKIYGPTRDLFKSIISGSKSIEDAIEAYKVRLNVLKITDTIDAINSDLN